MAEEDLTPWRTGNDISRWHGYLMPGSKDTPLNHLGIDRKPQLERAEAEYVEMRRAERLLDPQPMTFDLDHLRGINRQLFQDVYPFAGEVRTVDMSRGQYSFCPFEEIEDRFADLSERLHAANDLQGLDAPAFADAVAEFYGEANGIHPFREGNGRSQREFFDDLAHQAGHRIDWEALYKEQNDLASDAGRTAWEPDYNKRKPDYSIPLKVAREADLGPLKQMFAPIVHPIENRSAPREAMPGPRSSQWSPRRGEGLIRG